MAVFVLLLVVNAGLLAGALAVGQAHEIAPSAFYRDPAATLKANFAIGWLSHLGAVCWLVAGSLALFTAMLVGGSDGRALAGLGGLTLLLGLDDLFMVHDGVLEFLGGSGVVLVAGYGVGLLVWIGCCRGYLVETRWDLLAAGGLLLAISALADTAFDFAGLHGERAYLAEDFFKLGGILFWSAYAASCAWRAGRAAVHAGEVREGGRPAVRRDRPVLSGGLG